jgi:hypothetical protein
MFNFENINEYGQRRGYSFDEILLMRDKITIKSQYDPFQSKILSANQPFILINVCEFNFGDKWILLYRGSRDGFGANEFHFKCDGKSSTLTIVKTKKFGYVFGGFTSIPWHSLGQWESDPNAFLFSLVNKDRQPCKMITTNPSDSIYCDGDGFGPVFGDIDLCIIGDSNILKESSTRLNKTFKLPEYAKTDASEFLAGEYNFLLTEIEVYQKI